MPTDEYRARAMDQIERAVAEKAAKACNKRYGEYFDFTVTGQKFTDGRYVISRHAKVDLKGLDVATTNIAITSFIDGFRIAALELGEW